MNVKRAPWYLGSRAVAGAVAVLVAVVVILIYEGSSHNATLPPVPSGRFKVLQLAPAVILDAVVNPSAAAIKSAGSGGTLVVDPWSAVNGVPTAVLQNGKPVFDYEGAEFCPYCAADRWALINALSRFGTLKGVRLMTSDANDVYPSTNTFTFRTATYASDWLVLVHTEDFDNQHHPLETSTGLALAMGHYNTGPNSGIPFVNLADRATSTGATFGPNLLHRDPNPSDTQSPPLTWNQITVELETPGSSIQTAVVGSGNWLTAGICKMTDNKPASACGNPTIQGLEAKVGFTRQ